MKCNKTTFITQNSCKVREGTTGQKICKENVFKPRKEVATVNLEIEHVCLVEYLCKLKILDSSIYIIPPEQA